MADKRLNVLRMPARTFTAKIAKVPWETTAFKLAGTLDGFIDRKYDFYARASASDFFHCISIQREFISEKQGGPAR